MTTETPRRLIVGISGASGTVYGIRLLELLRDSDIETHLVMSKSAELTLAYETDLKTKDIRALATSIIQTRYRRDHLVGLVSDHGHGGGAVLDQDHERDRDRGHEHTPLACGRRRAQGAPPPRPRGARDPAHGGHLRTMTAALRHGRDHRPDRAGVLQPPENRSTTSSTTPSAASSTCSASTPWP